MTQRYYIHTRYHHPDTGMSRGMLTIDTPLDKTGILAMVKSMVEENLLTSTMFTMEGTAGLLNPFRFIGEFGDYLVPVVESEDEYEARMHQGLSVPTS